MQHSNHLPQFLCIGAQKAGTSWLDVNLRQHPEIWMPPIKELHFFDHIFVKRFRNWTTKHIEIKVTAERERYLSETVSPDSDYLAYLETLGTTELFTERWYHHAFSPAEAQGKLRGEVTPEYSTLPERGVLHVKEFLDAPKIIYLIRHPVSRAISQIRMNLDKRYGDRLPEVTSGWSEAEWCSAVHNWDVQQRGRYSDFVPIWDRHFGPDDILYLPYGRIGDEPEALLGEIEQFLGVSRHRQYPRAHQRIHARKKMPFPECLIRETERTMADQVGFLRERFGEAFLETT